MHHHHHIHSLFRQFPAKPSGLVRVDLTYGANSIKSNCSILIDLAKKAYDHISSIPSESKSFANTAKAIALVEGYFATFATSLTFPQFISTDPEVRKASVEANKGIDDFLVDTSMRQDLYLSVKLIPDIDSLSPIDKRLYDRLLRDFRRAGLELENNAEKENLKDYRKKISSLSIEFSSCISEDTTFLVFTKDQLAGLSEGQLGSFESAPSGYKVTMKYPDYFAVMKYCSVEETRAAVETANSSRCTENCARLVEILKLRDACSKLLSFKDHSSFVLETQMASKPSQVFSFLKSISSKLGALLEKEKAALYEEKVAEKGPSASPLEIYDFHYYNQIQAAKIGVDEQVIARYFPLSIVLRRMLSIYEAVLNLKFKEIPSSDFWPWHPSVQLFQVFDSAATTDADAATEDSAPPIGYFYTDLFPRDGKYSHAACFSLQPGMDLCKVEDEWVTLPSDENVTTHSTANFMQVPVAAMVANFTKPDADGNSWLKHYEVVTLFHELGHVMHHICSKSPYSRFHGLSVESDFVEAPSQMLENWCWEADSLSFLTDGTLPTTTIDALLATKLLNMAHHYLRQIFFGLFDMVIHSCTDHHPDEFRQVNPDQWSCERIRNFWLELRYQLVGMRADPNSFGGSTFGHLVGGYDAGYYGYLWSQVISADFFASAFKGHLLDPHIGLQYRRSVLEPGSTRDAVAMAKDFLGRSFNESAFLKSIGL